MTTTLFPGSAQRRRNLATGLVAAVVALGAVQFRVFSVSQGDQVLRPVVITDAVDMVDVLACADWTSERQFCDNAVLGNITGPGPVERAGVRRDVNVTVPVSHPCADKGGVVWPTFWTFLHGSVAVSRHEGQGLADEVAQTTEGVGRDGSALAASAFADPSWGLSDGGNVPLATGFQAVALPEACLVVPRASARWQQGLSASTRTELIAVERWHGSLHAESITFNME
jgi:hypothetical protein